MRRIVGESGNVGPKEFEWWVGRRENVAPFQQAADISQFLLPPVLWLPFLSSILTDIRKSSLTPPPPPVQKVLRPTQFFCITPFLKCPTQLICISHIYLLSTDKYKRHSRGICYPWTNLSNCMWSHELFFMMIFFWLPLLPDQKKGNSTL